MGFEEQFPSLKDLFIQLETNMNSMSIGASEDIKTQIMREQYVPVKYLQEHCIDKQNVREAILSHFSEGSLNSREQIKLNLLKELGLTQ